MSGSKRTKQFIGCFSMLASLGLLGCGQADPETNETESSVNETKKPPRPNANDSADHSTDAGAPSSDVTHDSDTNSDETNTEEDGSSNEPASTGTSNEGAPSGAGDTSSPEPSPSGLDATSEPSPPVPSSELAAPPDAECHIELTCADEIPDEPKVDCDVVVTIDDERAYEGLCAIERRGRSSLRYAKANYAVELRREDGSNLEMDFFGFGKDEDWIFDGSWVDRSFMRNALVSDLFRAFSPTWYAPESAYCTLELNGETQGLYRLVERIKRSNTRVPLSKDDGTGASFIVKQETNGPLHLNIGLESGWETVYPNHPTEEQLKGIQAWLDRLSSALKSRSDADDGVFALLNQPNVVDWILLQEFAKNIDAYKLSIFITKDVGQRGQLVPWDFDLAFGQPTVNDGTELVTAHETSGWVVQRTPFVQDIVAVPGFAEKLSSRWQVLRAGPLRDEIIERQLEAYERIVSRATEENFTVWPLAEVKFEPIFSRFHLYEVDSFEEEMDRVRTWIKSRLLWVDENIDAYVDGP